MLSDDNDNQSGLFSIMGGSIVVVLAGLAIALHVQNGSVFSKNMMELRRDLATGETEIEQLRANRQEMSREAADCDQRRKDDEAYQELLRQLRNLDQRRTTLKASRADLQSSIDRLHEEFLKHRAKIWAAATGESLGDLKIRSGRVFRGSVITEIDEVGLKIKHQDGSARVNASELDPARRDRFQWSDEERLHKLKQEEQLRLYQESAPRETEPARDQDAESPEAAPPNVAPPKADAAKLEKLRGGVRAWKIKVAQLRAESNEAIAKANSGRQVSVPGSLETWRERAANLGRELGKARENLALAKALLADLAPGDPLLNSLDDHRE